MDNQVSAIIVTYNANVVTIVQQYHSLCAQVKNIIYVDNGSDNYDIVRNAIIENSVSDINIHFLHNEINLGLGVAHNQGITKAIEVCADYILILDHDSVLKPCFVMELLKATEKLESETVKVGAVGPIYINEETGEKYPITKYFGPFIKRLKPLNTPVEASVLISSGTLVSMAVLNVVGGMDKGLFVDYIDVEWSYRVRKYGYKLFAVPSAMMNHQIGDKRTSVFGRKISVHSPIRRYYLTRNSIHMLRNCNVGFGYKLRELVFNLLRVIVFAIISNDRKEYLKYSYAGLLDGIRGIYGPYKKA